MMVENAQSTAYRAPVGISWIVQSRGVQILDEIARCSESLGYPEAAVWELLVHKHDPVAASAMLTWILDITDEEARAHIERCVQTWIKAGWLRTTDSGAG